MPVDRAKFDVNRCNERGEKPDFWPVSKFNTGNLPLRGNPAGKKEVKTLNRRTGSSRVREGSVEDTRSL